MRFTTDLYAIDFDLTGYKQALHNFMVETTKEAARSWLRTVLVIIPTWSRASRATFEALANEVGFHVTYGPIKSKKDRLLLGMSTGEGGLQIVRNKTYYFYYKTSLRYLQYNEMNVAVPGPYPQPYGELLHDTPYRFREAGRNDFRSFANSILLPSPKEFIKPVKI